MLRRERLSSARAPSSIVLSRGTAFQSEERPWDPLGGRGPASAASSGHECSVSFWGLAAWLFRRVSARAFGTGLTRPVWNPPWKGVAGDLAAGGAGFWRGEGAWVPA